MFASFTAFSSDLLTSLDFKNKEKKWAIISDGHQVSSQTVAAYNVLGISGCTLYCVHYTLTMAPY